MHVVLSLSLILKAIYFCKYDKQGLFNDVSYAVEICEQTMISAKINSNFYDVYIDLCCANASLDLDAFPQ